MSSESFNGVTTASKSTQINFIAFWVGQLFSLFGSSVVFFSVFIYFAELTKDNPNQGTIFTTVSAIIAIPFTLVLFFSGVFIDRWNRKKIIIISDAVQAISTLVLVVLFMLGYINSWPTNLYVIAGIFMIRQVAQGFHGPAIQAIIPLMIPKEKISRFNGINTFVSSAVHIVGPIFSGFLIGLGLDFTQILWIDVITFLIALMPAILITIPPHKLKTIVKEEKSSYIQEFKEGFRTIMNIRGMPALFLVIIVLNTLSQPYGQLQAIFFQKIAGDNYYNLLAYNGIFFQVAILLGGGIMMLRKKWKRKALLIIGTQFFGILAWFLIALAGFSFPYWLVYIATSLTGLYASIYNTTYQTIFHETIPPDKLGRVFSVDYAISFFLGPVATLASGPIADWLGIQNLYLGIAIFAAIFMTLMVIFSDYRFVGKDTLEKPIEERNIKELPDSIKTP